MLRRKRLTHSVLMVLTELVTGIFQNAWDSKKVLSEKMLLGPPHISSVLTMFLRLIMQVLCNYLAIYLLSCDEDFL